MSEPKVSEMLLLAKDKIIDGWVPRQPVYRDEVYETCAVLAISEAAGKRGSLEEDELEDRAESILREVIGLSGFDSLADWSDSGPKQKVIDGFDAAIRLAKEREQS